MVPEVSAATKLATFSASALHTPYYSRYALICDSFESEFEYGKYAMSARILFRSSRQMPR